MSAYVPWFVLLLVSAVWGAAFALIKYLLSFVGPFDLVVYRFIPTSLISLLVVLFVFRRTFAEAFRTYWRVFLLLSFAWVFFYHVALNVGETVLPAGPAGLIISTYPVFTVLVAAMVKMERLTWQKAAGGLVALAGTVLLTVLGAGDEAARIGVRSSEWIVYSLITLVAPVSAAVTTLVNRHYLSGEDAKGTRMSAAVMSLGYMLPSGLFSLVFLRPEHLTAPLTFPVGFWLALGALVVFCTFLAHFGWFWVLKHIEAGPASIATYTIPIFSLLYARFWLGELLTWPSVIAASGIVLGVVISGIHPPEKPPSSGREP